MRTARGTRVIHTARVILAEGKAAPLVLDWARAIVRANEPSALQTPPLAKEPA